MQLDTAALAVRQSYTSADRQAVNSALGSAPAAANAARPVRSATAALNPEEVRKVRETAVGFESILVRHWLQSVRESSFAPEETASKGYLDLADDKLADVVGKQGGFGLAKQMTDVMMRQIGAAKLMQSADSAVNSSVHR